MTRRVFGFLVGLLASACGGALASNHQFFCDDGHVCDANEACG